MSVLIKGMEMPKAGQLLQVAENVDGTIFIRETTQGEWHQLVEVPTPHGRLKDADSIMHAVSLMIGLNGDPAIIIEDIIEGETTVIEAEE